MRNLLILGAGGHGQIVREIAELMGCFNLIDFLDDNREISIGKLSEINKFKYLYTDFFVALGDNFLRLTMIEKLVSEGYEIPILIHPRAYVSATSKIEIGTVIEALAVINTNATISKGCIIDSGAIIDHDAILGKGVHADCGSIVKAYCRIEDFIKVDAGNVVR